MNETDPSPNGAPKVTTEQITAAIQQAVREAVLTHARMGRSVPEWRDGKVVWVSPEEILASFDQSPSNSGKAQEAARP